MRGGSVDEVATIPFDRKHSRTSTQLASLSISIDMLASDLVYQHPLTSTSSARTSPISSLRPLPTSFEDSLREERSRPAQSRSPLATSPDRGRNGSILRHERRQSIHHFDYERNGQGPPPSLIALPPSPALMHPSNLSAGNSTRDSSPPNTAHLVQEKRRQASAPFAASVRTTSSMFGSTTGLGMSRTGDDTAILDAFGEDSRRAKSRRGSRAATSALQPLRISEDRAGSSSICGPVMTPTTEEWRALGGRLSELADIRARDEAILNQGLHHHATGSTPSATSLSNYGHASGSASGSSTASTSSLEISSFRHSAETPLSISPVSFRSSTPLHIHTSPIMTPHAPTIPSSLSSTARLPSSSSFPDPSPNASPTHSHSQSLAVDYRMRVSSSISDSSAASIGLSFTPTHRLLQSESSLRPNLSRGSLSSTSNTATPSHDGSPRIPMKHTFSEPVLMPAKPIELDMANRTALADPRQYSAVTGFRTIDSFVIQGDAGKGAYGMVKRAREKSSSGEPIGPDLIIKCIVKQRILADCWKKHKILGVIPIEIHVLDHLRRVLYLPRLDGRRRLGETSAGRSPVNCDFGRQASTKAIGHPNICGFLDFFEDSEFYYLVMPCAGGNELDDEGSQSGQDLFDLVEACPDGLAIASAHRIFSQVADAVCFLHDHGIVHRDIKDENIVLDLEGNVQVIDFGSAAYVKEGRKFDTFSGTLDFAAPEVLRGERYGGKESDIWALGVLGYVILCGECPFWSPEEAILGLYRGSRAEQALLSKCSSSSTFTADRLDLSARTSLGVLDSSGSHYDVEGRVEDAVELVMRCLEIEPRDRPTSQQVMDHRFIVGADGWSGTVERV